MTVISSPNKKIKATLADSSKALEGQRLVEEKKKITKTRQTLNYIISYPKKLTLTTYTI